MKYIISSLFCFFLSFSSLWAQIAIDSVFVRPSTCVSCSGEVTVLVSGGIGPLTYNWNTGDSTASISQLCADSTYSLTVTDAQLNTVTRQFTIPYTGDSCVWPGDTDNDGRVTHFDLLNIGLLYNQNVVARPLPNLSVAWTGFSQPDDSLFNNNIYVGLPDVKHIDCDGNGVIDNTDLIAIDSNYGNSYPTVKTPQSFIFGNTPFGFDTLTSSVYYQDSLRLDISIGDSLNPVNAYGVAFTLSYDSNYLSFDRMDFNNSVLGQNIIHYVNSDTPGKVHMAMSRRTSSPVNIAGVLATSHWGIEDIILFVQPGDSVPTTVVIEDIRIIDPINQAIGPNPQNKMVHILKNQSAVSQLMSNQNAFVSCLPNPAKHQVAVRAERQDIQSVEIYDMQGRLINRIEGLNQELIQMNTTNYQRGLYIFKIQTSKGIANKKILLN